MTAESITDEQIRELWRSGLIDSIERNVAIRQYRHGLGNTLRQNARARCAEIINNGLTRSP